MTQEEFSRRKAVAQRIGRSNRAFSFLSSIFASICGAFGYSYARYGDYFMIFPAVVMLIVVIVLHWRIGKLEDQYKKL